MSLSALLYLTELLSNINGTLKIIIAIYVVSCVIVGFFWCISNDGYSEEAHQASDQIIKSFFKKSWILIICLTIQVMIPSKTTMYMMLASNYLSNSNIPSQVNEILTLKLSDIIKDLKKENKE